jgi:hypothetical protein
MDDVDDDNSEWQSMERDGSAEPRVTIPVEVSDAAGLQCNAPVENNVTTSTEPDEHTLLPGVGHSDGDDADRANLHGDEDT